MLAVDLLIVGRRPHEPSMREAGTWVGFYVALALIFGAGVWVTAGGTAAGEFYTGWLTEYSLSVDNLFVFVIIMARFAVPRRFQQKVLLIGIVLALVMRGAFIAAGKRLFTPMLIVMIAIGTTDLIFALDSIPAIFGITKEPDLVFTANVFALMGLRQLYFLLGGPGVHWARETPMWLRLLVITGPLGPAAVPARVRSSGDRRKELTGTRV